ncbi:hypothetical protein V6N13_034271 [Hibiscus sabdariffa]
MPMETVVPDSIQSQAVKSMELVRMWEGNMQLDLRVRDTASWMAEEDIGIIDRDEEQRCNAMDLSVECEFSEVRQVILDDKSVATSPINRGPQDRAKLAVVIEYGGSRERKRVILREAEETVQLGKLIGATPKVVLVGRWEVEDLRCGIIGLYAPCIVTQQTEFWEKVELIILEKDVAWCVGVILTWLGVWKRDEVV